MNGAISCSTKRYGSISGMLLTSTRFFQRFYSNSSSLEHPFFKLSKIEQFALSFSQTRQSLANGADIFPICVENLNGMSKQLTLSSLDLSNNVTKWLLHYRTRCINSNQNTLLPLNEKVDKPSVYITKEKYPQLTEIVELFENDTLATTDPVALNSLIDYTLLNNHSGLYAENIYSFLLHNYGNSSDKLNLIVGSIRLHLNNKLDYFPDIENIVFKILITVNKLPKNTDISSFDRIFQDLLQGISSRFTLETIFSGFNNKILNQLLDYQLMWRQSAIESKVLFSLLMSRNVRPLDKNICQYLSLLDNKTKDLKPKDAKLQKLLYLSDFRGMIEQHPPIELVEFLVPLCDTINELRSILQIIKKQGDKQIHYFNEVLPLLLNQYSFVLVPGDTIYPSIEIGDLFDTVNEIYQGNIPNEFLQKIIILMVSRWMYSKAATIIDSHPSLKNSDFLQELGSHVHRRDTIERQRFLKHFKIPLKVRSTRSYII
ncbi:ATPase expression protein 1, mitochondrial [Monosporozyma unispora]